MSAMIGVALILAGGIGSTNLMNAITPDLLVGLSTDLTSFMIGPMLATIAAFIASLIASKVINIITPKWSLALGTVCVSVFLAIVAYATTVELWIVASLLNGVVLAFGAYAAAAGVVSEFQGMKTQSVFGVVSGVGALIVSLEVFIESQMLTIMTYREAFYIFAVAILVVGLFSNFVLIGKIPSKKKAQPKGSSEEKTADASDATSTKAAPPAQAPSAPGITVREAMKSPALYLFVAAMFFGAWALNGILSFLSIFFSTFGMATADAAAFIGLLTAAIALTKFASGWLIKKFGTKGLTLIILVLFITGVACLLMWAQTNNVILIYVGLVVISVIGYISLVPALYVPDIFGMKDYVGLNAVGMAGFYIGAATLLMGLSVIISSFGIFNGYILLIFMGTIAMACLFVALLISPFKKIDIQRQDQDSEV